MLYNVAQAISRCLGAILLQHSNNHSFGAKTGGKGLDVFYWNPAQARSKVWLGLVFFGPRFGSSFGRTQLDINGKKESPNILSRGKKSSTSAHTNGFQNRSETERWCDHWDLLLLLLLLIGLLLQTIFLSRRGLMDSHKKDSCPGAETERAKFSSLWMALCWQHYLWDKALNIWWEVKRLATTIQGH